jgi:hypothetical protein
MANEALTAQQIADRKEGFEQAEATLRIEGLDPSGDPHYESIKARVIAGTLTTDEAVLLIDQHHGVRAAKVHDLAAIA